MAAGDRTVARPERAAVSPSSPLRSSSVPRTIIAKGLTVREAAVRLKVGKTALYDALRG
jgi:hypothetical protein